MGFFCNSYHQMLFLTALETHSSLCSNQISCTQPYTESTAFTAEPSMLLIVVLAVAVSCEPAAAAAIITVVTVSPSTVKLSWQHGYISIS